MLVVLERLAKLDVGGGNGLTAHFCNVSLEC